MSALAEVVPEKVVGWRERLAVVVQTTREMSRQTDPSELRRIYVERTCASCGRSTAPCPSAAAAFSRRGAASRAAPRWAEEINPWKEPDRLPLVSGGLLPELIYGDEPRLFDDLRVADDEPAAEYLAEFRSVVAIPLYDGGEALNMALLMRREPGGVRPGGAARHGDDEQPVRPGHATSWC